MSEGISPAPVDRAYVVKPAQEPIQIPAENPPGDCSEVGERIMGELKALGVDRIETQEFVSGRPNFIIQAGEGGPGDSCGHFVIGGHMDTDGV